MLIANHAPLAQLVEQLALNQTVGGSNPSRRTEYYYLQLTIIHLLVILEVFFLQERSDWCANILSLPEVRCTCKVGGRDPGVSQCCKVG